MRKKSVSIFDYVCTLPSPHCKTLNVRIFEGVRAGKYRLGWPTDRHATNETGNRSPHAVDGMLQSRPLRGFVSFGCIKI